MALGVSQNPLDFRPKIAVANILISAPLESRRPPGVVFLREAGSLARGTSPGISRYAGLNAQALFGGGSEEEKPNVSAFRTTRLDRSSD